MLSPIMATRADSRSFVEACVLLTLLVAVHAAPQDEKWILRSSRKEVCDKIKCPGPLRLYEVLGCTPVYKNPGDCCADRYNCSHLKELSKDKCYANGHVYRIGEILRPEHRNTCDLSCLCTETANEFIYFSAFRCGTQRCPHLPIRPNCYYRNSHDECCAVQQVCVKEGEKWPTCEVDDQVYVDGEFFQPESDPETDCICMPGYKGENVEPFCRKRNHTLCDPLFYHPDMIYENCAPVFDSFEDPQTNCHPVFRCYNARDTVIHNHDSTKARLKTDEDDMCRFGNLTMHRGDELKEGTDYDSVCLKCVCEVPPLVTCVDVWSDECNVSA